MGLDYDETVFSPDRPGDGGVVDCRVASVAVQEARRAAAALGRASAMCTNGESGRRIADETRRKTQHALAEAATRSARLSMKRATRSAKPSTRLATSSTRPLTKCGWPSFPTTTRSRALPPVPPSPPAASEEAEGLPVPIVPGTRVTEAEARPPTPADLGNRCRYRPCRLSPRDRTVTGRLSATRERAVADARRQLRDEVANWLDPEVPHSWTPPARMLDAMVVGEPRIKSIEKDYGELFEATLTVDTSPQRRTALIEVYNRQLVERRLATLGATLAFILICLAAISGYIRADEATKGYYTNRLRMLAAAGVGASGVIIYHMVA